MDFLLTSSYTYITTVEDFKPYTNKIVRCNVVPSDIDTKTANSFLARVSPEIEHTKGKNNITGYYIEQFHPTPFKDSNGVIRIDTMFDLYTNRVLNQSEEKIYLRFASTEEKQSLVTTSYPQQTISSLLQHQ